MNPYKYPSLNETKLEFNFLGFGKYATSHSNPISGVLDNHFNIHAHMKYSSFSCSFLDADIKGRL